MAGAVLIAAAIASCSVPPHGSFASCTRGVTTAVGTVAFLIALTSMAGAVAWVLALIRTAEVRRWGWFVAALLLSPFGSLVYGLWGPEHGT